MTVCFFCRKLRHSEASQLLLNLSFGLLGLYITFILAIRGSSLTVGLCAVVGALVHYFLLVVFFAMGAEAVDLFMKLVIVLGPKIQKFVLKTFLVSWSEFSDECHILVCKCMIIHFTFSISVAPIFIVLFCFAPYYGHYVTSF